MRRSSTRSLAAVSLVVLPLWACAAARPQAQPQPAFAGSSATDGPEGGASLSPPPEMQVVEAEATVAVDAIARAAGELRSAVAALGGTITQDEVVEDAHFASFELRVPPASLEPLYASLAGLGELRRRRVRVQDVTRQVVDQEIQLDNLTQTLARYQEILAKASDVQEMLAVEAQLHRVRGEIERLKGELAYLRDRVALATVSVTLLLKEQAAIFAPRAKLHPGLRGSYLALFRKGDAPAGAYGPGFSLHFDRSFHLDVDVLAAVGKQAFRADAILAHLGAEMYSDFLGRGRRPWLNPYFGFALGYARFGNQDNCSLGGSLGVELVKTTYVLLDLNLRVLTLLGESRPTLTLQPTLALNVAF